MWPGLAGGGPGHAPCDTQTSHMGPGGAQGPRGEARSGPGDGRPAGALQIGLVGPHLVAPPNRNGQQQGTGAQVRPPSAAAGRKGSQGCRAPGTAVSVPPAPGSQDQAGTPACRARRQPSPAPGAHRIL